MTAVTSFEASRNDPPGSEIATPGSSAFPLRPNGGVGACL